EPDTPILDLVADLRASTPTDAAKRIVPDVREELAGVAGMRERASLAVRAILDRETHGLASIRSRPVLANPSTMIDAQDVLIAEARLRARRSLGHRLDRSTDEVGHHLARVRGLSPLSTMARGYNVAQLADGTVIASVGQLTVDAEFSLRFTDGNVVVRTLSIDPKEQSHD
ncbi:MAG: exodeoxyribonuclease VII large subunit, partial [Kineosporiaceae bacterium]|nr:exodeoxyribonuclease VII large subunit [Aeromicrobium sp.]